MGERDVVTADAGVDAPTCSGLDASVSGLTIQPACETCIGDHCCAQAQACAMTPGCKEIEECATKCIAMAIAPMTCAVMCIEGDAGMPEGGQLSVSQTAARTLDLCLITTCNVCAPP
jgi:hypothetical protein